MWIDQGRNVFAEKWGHKECDLIGSGLRPEHAWRVEKDWLVKEQREKEREAKMKKGLFWL